MRKIYVISLFLLMLLLIGCQSTPMETPVAQKKDLAYIVSQAKCDPKVYQYEDSIHKQWNFKNVIFNIDAKVSMPDIDQIPVFSVKPKIFSVESVIRMIEYFEPGRQWYEFDKNQFTYIQKSKEKLEEEYIKLKTDTYFKEHNPEMYASSIDEYEKIIKEAPAVFNPPKYDIHTQIKENCDFRIGTNIKDDPILMDTYYNDNSSAFLYSKGQTVQVEKRIELDGKKPVPIEIDEQTAIDMGNKTIEDLGLSGSMKLAHAERAFLYGNDVSGQVKSGGYYLVYLMRAGELDVKYIGEGAVINPGNTPEYSAPPWEQQCIEIFTDKNGVQYFYWRGYSDITEKVADNVQIIGFEEVKNRIYKQLEYRYKPMADSGGNDTKVVTTINVENISFGTALLALKDNTKEAYMIPVWYVPYTIKDAITYTDESGEKVQKDIDMEDALVINAIDGSVAEPRVAL